MQDRYAGDIGDYGKFALLRAMEAQGLTVGVNWYLSKTLPSEIHDDGKYRIPSQYEKLDPGLSAALNRIFDLREDRSVLALEQAHLLATNLFVNEVTLPLHTRLTDEDVEYVISNYVDIIKNL